MVLERGQSKFVGGHVETESLRNALSQKGHDCANDWLGGSKRRSARIGGQKTRLIG